MENKVVVIGASKLSRYLARSLNEDGENVIVIDKDPLAFNKLDEFSGFTEVGDATDLSVLESVDIKNSKFVIIATNDDNVNLYLSDVCFHIFDITNIYIRLSDAEKAKLISTECIHTICPFSLSIEKFTNIYKRG